MNIKIFGKYGRIRWQRYATGMHVMVAWFL